MKKSIYLLEIICHMNERLFNNALQGITEEQAQERITEHNNSVSWLAAHTVWARNLMLLCLGKPAKGRYEGMFENFKPYDASVTYPALAESKEEWNKVTALLKDALQSVTEEDLAGDSPIKSPTGDFTHAGTLAFLIQHESYDIGQLGFLKKYLTKEAMSYN